MSKSNMREAGIFIDFSFLFRKGEDDKGKREKKRRGTQNSIAFLVCLEKKGEGKETIVKAGSFLKRLREWMVYVERERSAQVPGTRLCSI